MDVYTAPKRYIEFIDYFEQNQFKRKLKTWPLSLEEFEKLLNFYT